jgi:hypothetical protein
MRCTVPSADLLKEAGTDEVIDDFSGDLVSDVGRRFNCAIIAK